MIVVHNAGFYSGPLNSEEHFHSCCEIFYLKKGKIHLKIEGKEYIPAENSVHILSPMEKHGVTCLSEEYERYIIFMDLHNFEAFFTNPLLTTVLKNRPREYSHVFPASNPDILSVFKRCVEEHELHSGCQFTNLRMVNLVSELLMLLYRSSPQQFSQNQENNRLIEVQKYIDNNYDNLLKLRILQICFT